MSVIACTYFDGKSSLARPASVIIARRQVQVVGHDVAQSYDARRVRLSEPIGTTPRWIYLPDGGACWVAESGSLSHFARDSRLNRVVHQWESRPALAALALGLVVALVWALIQFGVPAGARFVAERIPESAETRLGVETLAGLDKQWMTPTKLSAARQQALRAKFDKMVKAGGAATNAAGNGAAGGGTLGDAVGKSGSSAAVRLEFRASKVIGPNAFALPGGIMVMTDELVALAKHDNELLGVLAHELGHLRERHAMRGLLESSAVALLIAGITGDIASTASLAASAPVLLLQNKFSRGNETEADQFAIALMQKASIDPKHFAIMLGRLEEKSEGGAFIPAFLSSHPATEARKALALEASRSKPVEQRDEEPADKKPAATSVPGRAAAATPVARAAADEPVFDETRKRVIALSAGNQIDALEALLAGYQSAFEQDHTQSRPLEIAFSAYFYLPSGAETVFDAWLEKFPNSYAAYTARAAFYMDQGVRARGDDFAKATAQEKFDVMHSFHSKAAADLERSRTLTAKPYLAQRYLMSIARHSGDRPSIRRHYQEAIRLAPRSLTTRLAYMETLEPRWGGSVGQMEQFADESKSATEPKDYASLQARLPAYRAFEAEQAKNYPQALRENDLAIAFSDSAGLRCQRAYVLGKLQRPAEAFSDLQRAYALDPDYKHCFSAATSVATDTNDHQEAVRILNYLVEQSRATADTFGRRGWRYQQLNRLPEAYADYLVAANIGDANSELMVGKMLWSGWGVAVDRERAMTWLKKAADKGDRDAVVSYQQAQEMLRSEKK